MATLFGSLEQTLYLFFNIETTMDALEQFVESVDALTHSASEWITSKADQVNVTLPEVASPEAVVAGATGALLTLLLTVYMVVRCVSIIVWRRRVRNNALIVQMAECAPEDDCEEHELEKHNAARAPAPGDSDHEDDLLASPRKGRKS